MCMQTICMHSFVTQCLQYQYFVKVIYNNNISKGPHYGGAEFSMHTEEGTIHLVVTTITIKCDLLYLGKPKMTYHLLLCW